MNNHAINSSDLLRRLQPAVNPAASGAAGPGRAGDAAALFELQPFDQLLTRAFAGEISSDRPVQAACDLQPPLNGEQLQRLALAADRAEAGGAQRALMMIDGRGFVMDITGRAITAEMNPNEAGAMLQIDTAMLVPAGSGTSSYRTSAQHAASLLPTNPTVARLLETLADGQVPTVRA